MCELDVVGLEWRAAEKKFKRFAANYKIYCKVSIKLWSLRMANVVLICHHGRVFSNAFQHLGRTLSVVVTGRSHRFLKLADFSCFAFSLV